MNMKKTPTLLFSRRLSYRLPLWSMTVKLRHSKNTWHFLVYKPGCISTQQGQVWQTGLCWTTCSHLVPYWESLISSNWSTTAFSKTTKKPVIIHKLYLISLCSYFCCRINLLCSCWEKLNGCAPFYPEAIWLCVQDTLYKYGLQLKANAFAIWWTVTMVSGVYFQLL